jgi:acetylornithine aminotransferase
LSKTFEYLEKEKRLFLSTYSRIPIEISHGEGVYLISKEGERYLDFYSGLAVNALGYAHTKIIDAIKEQIKRYSHLSNLYITESQLTLAEKLIHISGMDKVFFTNSGTEAIEAAIKVIRKKYGAKKKIFSLSGSFHGRTYGSLSLTSNENYRLGFEPLLPYTDQILFDNLDDLHRKVDENTAAIFLEVLQGESGINFISRNFINVLHSLREKYGFAIITDEIQCGLGRTGKAFAFNYHSFEPDIITVAKALGGGLPLGAILINRNYSNVFASGEHGSTFGGNPVACTAGNVVLSEIFENGLLGSVNKMGEYFKEQLNQLMNNHPLKIKEVRGLGFMLGIELNKDCDKIVTEMRNKNVLVNCTNKNVLRILPPLIIQIEHIDYFLNHLDETLTNI